MAVEPTAIPIVDRSGSRQSLRVRETVQTKLCTEVAAGALLTFWIVVSGDIGVHGD
jgi:hypothetical protein